ncbi:unnamed protein product [Lasius platythorax]|uniref:Uncharacterized protein n=1 Tax=Lasius platythorax TaxID=488582 RepID=A0AAV2MZW8_9HYME
MVNADGRCDTSGERSQVLPLFAERSGESDDKKATMSAVTKDKNVIAHRVGGALNPKYQFSEKIMSSLVVKADGHKRWS